VLCCNNPCAGAASTVDAKGGAGIPGGRRIEGAVASTSKRRSSAEPRSRSTSAAGGSTSSMGPEVISDGGARRWTADETIFRVDGGGSGKVGRMGSTRGGSGLTL
jgi:hypothetical protein